MTNKKKHPPAPFKGGTLFVIFACLKTCFHWGLAMTAIAVSLLRDPKDGIKQAKNDKLRKHPPAPICSASETDTLIDSNRNVQRGNYIRKFPLYSPPLEGAGGGGQGDVSFVCYW